MIKEGMVIKIFPDTDVESYTRYIRNRGYHYNVDKEHIYVLCRVYDSIDKVKLGRKLRLARIDKHMSRELMAIRIGVKPDSITQWENGRRKPTEINLARYCRIVGLDEGKVLDECSVIKAQLS